MRPFASARLTTCVLLAACRLYAFGPTVSGLPRVDDVRLDSALARTAQGILRVNVDPYSDGLVHRPNSEEPGDAVSEAQAYGMIVFLYSGDQASFNRVWDAAETNMWNDGGQEYDWRVGPSGGVIGTGMATDADQDIALMLLFADSLVSKGMWQTHTSPKGATYLQRAHAIIANIWNTAVVSGRYLAPGGGWGGSDFVNPGYFSPATYKIFAQADPAHDWNGVVDQCYQTLFASPGAGKGLLPDWMVPDGTFYNGSLGYNAYRNGQSMYKDGIRVQWRLALDWLWFGDTRAKRWLDSAAAFIQSPGRANFYTMDGVALPASDTFHLGDGAWRSRREASELTVGMWACAAFSSLGPTASQPWVDSLLNYAPPTSDRWGLPADTGISDRSGSAPNEEYFEQFLGWFGAAVMAGRFSNIWDDLADPLPGVPVAWTSPPTVSDQTLDFQVAPLQVQGLLNKPATWTLRITQSPSGTQWSTSAHTATVAATWNGMDATGTPFPQGWCLINVAVPGLLDQNQWVWLAHQKDLRVDSSWILIDDFSGPTLQPNLGLWDSFNNSSAEGTAMVGPLAPSGTGADRALTWSFNLGTGGYQYCGLEWQRDGWAGMSFANKVYYRARAAQPTVIDFYLVQSDITDNNYFGVFDTIGTSWKVYQHQLSNFKGRLSTRSGTANPALGSSFRWHVQFDKNPTITSGSVTVDDFRLGGNLSAMYTSPAPYSAPVGNPPSLRITPSMASQFGIPFWRNGSLQLQVPKLSTIHWFTLKGKYLGVSTANENGIIRWTPPLGFNGLILAQCGRTRIQPVLIP